MAYDQKTWDDRQSQYPNRRKLIETNLDSVFEIERAEGEVAVPGNRFNAENMNDLERRVSTAFTNLNDSEITVQDKNNHFTSPKLNGVLDELFTFAGDGKKAIASAIGTTQGGTATASMAFSQLSSLVKNNMSAYQYKSLRDLGYSADIIFDLKSGQSRSIEIDTKATFGIKHIFMEGIAIWYNLNGKIEQVSIAAYNLSSNLNYFETANITTTVNGSKLVIAFKANTDIQVDISNTAYIVALRDV